IIETIGVGTDVPRSAIDFRDAGQGLTGASANRMFMVPPKVSNAQRNNLTGLVSGAMIYNTNSNRLEVYTQNSNWVGIATTPGRKLGSYRNSHSDFKNENCGALTDLPLDTGIPKTGEIKFSDFYGKKLNMVVDYFDDTGNSGGTTPNILNREDNGNNTMAASWRYN
ncbi:MAG: hypothetical protein VXY93_22925, partial [Pseudomonadota bacterium]|nr:hypothetical protein [Pseudomonadota bacterium]